MSLCARSMVKPGAVSPTSTLLGKFIRNCPFEADVPYSTCSVLVMSSPKRWDKANASAFTWHRVTAT
ncbi:hypothetical protein D3C81_2339430 [compost metagenome]